ncbi:hypothetical protein PAPHI01_1441 [Pancytospora philotis]|nr:hypothetical protein PAPHI01_1441 [Pancytospora philotis]
MKFAVTTLIFSLWPRDASCGRKRKLPTSDTNAPEEIPFLVIRDANGWPVFDLSEFNLSHGAVLTEAEMPVLLHMYTQCKTHYVASSANDLVKPLLEDEGAGLFGERSVQIALSVLSSSDHAEYIKKITDHRFMCLIVLRKILDNFDKMVRNQPEMPTFLLSGRAAEGACAGGDSWFTQPRLKAVREWLSTKIADELTMDFLSYISKMARTNNSEDFIAYLACRSVAEHSSIVPAVHLFLSTVLSGDVFMDYLYSVTIPFIECILTRSFQNKSHVYDFTSTVIDVLPTVECCRPSYLNRLKKSKIIARLYLTKQFEKLYYLRGARLFQYAMNWLDYCYDSSPNNLRWARGILQALQNREPFDITSLRKLLAGSGHPVKLPASFLLLLVDRECARRAELPVPLPNAISEMLCTMSVSELSDLLLLAGQRGSPVSPKFLLGRMTSDMLGDVMAHREKTMQQAIPLQQNPSTSTSSNYTH